ncbi:MAG: hypothetical protein IJ203_03210 [Atopobiaceae bacterium]|jgi:hypothetical protein|nr:hypothetical protein [Atopobiaceae bacterium]
MRMLKRLRNDAIALVVLCAAGYVAYQVLLDDEAKEGVKSLVRTVTDSYQQLSNLVNDHIGTIMDEDVVVQNKAQIMNAWADLGF